MPHGQPTAQDSGTGLLAAVFAADAALDRDGFMALLAEDVCLHIGSRPPVDGAVAVRQAIAGLFGMMRGGIRHRLLTRFGSAPDIVACQAGATFALRDGRDVTLPCVNVLRRAPEGRVADCRILIDLAPLSS